MHRFIYYSRLTGFVFVVIGFVAACTTPSTMIGKEIGCSAGDVKILDSDFSREGSTTTWCARCIDEKFGSNYICATNPTRERMQCREVPLGPPCA